MDEILACYKLYSPIPSLLIHTHIDDLHEIIVKAREVPLLTPSAGISTLGPGGGPAGSTVLPSNKAKKVKKKQK